MSRALSVEFLEEWSASRCVFNNKITVETWVDDASFQLDLKAPFLLMFLDNNKKDFKKIKTTPSSWAMTLNHPPGHPNYLLNCQNIQRRFSNRSVVFLLLRFAARVWQHRWRVLAWSGKHLLADEPGNVQTADHAGGLEWPESVCRVCQLQTGARSWLLQTKSGPLPWQRRRLPHMA